MPLGDSITDGLTVPGGYRIGLWQKLVVAQVEANVVNWVRTTTPRSVLLHIGTNDMFSNSSGAPARLSTLIDHITATAPTADVFVATIIPLSGADAQVRAFNAAIPAIVAGKGQRVPLVDMYSALTTADLADGVHPNAGGYQKMADVWWRALQAVPGSIGDPGPPTSPPPTTPPPASCTAT